MRLRVSRTLGYIQTLQGAFEFKGLVVKINERVIYFRYTVNARKEGGESDELWTGSQM